MAVMLDLLLGAPGETRESLVCTVDLMKRARPDRVGVALGVPDGLAADDCHCGCDVGILSKEKVALEGTIDE